MTAQVGRPWFDSGDGFRYGALAVPLDVSLGLEASRSSGQPTSRLITSELSIDFTGLRPAPGEHIVVEGGVLSAAVDGALSGSRASTVDGGLLATATAWIRYVTPAPGRLSTTARDPDLVRAPRRTFDDVIGGRLIRTDTEVRLDARLTASLGNARGSLQGGVCAALGEWLGAQVLGEPWRVRGLRAHFLRPTPVETAVTATVSVLRRGRTYALADAVIAAESTRCCLLRMSYVGQGRAV